MAGLDSFEDSILIGCVFGLVCQRVDHLRVLSGALLQWYLARLLLLRS